jgi:hypothetical protein
MRTWDEAILYFETACRHRWGEQARQTVERKILKRRLVEPARSGLHKGSALVAIRSESSAKSANYPGGFPGKQLQ